MSIDLSLRNIWRSWFAFRKGKKPTSELNYFQYYLEKNLYNLFIDLNSGRYHHGGYRKFIVCDNKRREISVADIRDRVAHRLIYDYLNKIYDKTFVYDAWSCRVGKGLMGAVERIHLFLKHCPNGYVWKCDIKKFFDSIDHKILIKILSSKIKDEKTLILLEKIIESFQYSPGSRRGMPIGNLTSQIFANIYMNEFDRFIKYQLKPKAYLRYGDDFILIHRDMGKLKSHRDEAVEFLNNILKLRINFKNDKIIKISDGLKFLGAIISPLGKMLNRRNFRRISRKLNIRNISSYSGLVRKNGNTKQKEQFYWMVCEKLIIQGVSPI